MQFVDSAFEVTTPAEAAKHNKATKYFGRDVPLTGANIDRYFGYNQLLVGLLVTQTRMQMEPCPEQKHLKTNVLCRDDENQDTEP